MRRPSARWLWLLAPPLAALVVWGWWVGSQRVRETQLELAQLEHTKRELEVGNRSLASQVEALRRDREARVRAAREALDVAAPGEVLVVLPQPTPRGADRGAAAGDRGPARND